jgi:hypothetical protein
MTRTDLVARWRAQADDYERDGQPGAMVLKRVADELEALGAERNDRNGGLPGTSPPAKTNGEPMLTAKEVAQQLNVSERWVYDHQDQLGGTRLSPHMLRFPRAAVQRHVERRR